MEKIATELLVNIISFLSYEYTLICQSVYVNWFNSLKWFVKKTLILPVPKKMYYTVLWI